ncbi:MAG: VWA domain-containing protein [Candidatus Omnitrophota bacterium]
MRFGNIDAAYFLWFVLFLGLFYGWAFKRRRRALEALAEENLLPVIAASLNPARQRLKVIFIVAAVFFIIVAFMKPQYGFSWEEVRKKGVDILIAIDTSKSMLAEDVKPNRLERSKLAVRDLLVKLKGDRVGLIAFAGGAFLQCPLTSDYNGFILSLNDLGVNTIPKGGTSISSAIWEAIKTYKSEARDEKTLVIITDGEDHEGDPVRAAEAARKEKIKIFCVGIGTGEGELIPVKDETGQRVFLKDREGDVVKTRLDEAALERIARITGGIYVRARGAEFGLDTLYRERFSKMEKRVFGETLTKRYRERFQIPLFVAFLLLAAEIFITERRALP